MIWYFGKARMRRMSAYGESDEEGVIMALQSLTSPEALLR
jgi:hypothetical protein